MLSSEIVLLNTLGYFIFPTSLYFKSYIQKYFIHTHTHTQQFRKIAGQIVIW